MPRLTDEELAWCGLNLKDRAAPLLDGKRNTHAGYLARCIVEHDSQRVMTGEA